MRKRNIGRIKVACTLLLLVAAWLAPAVAVASDQDKETTGFKKEFPSFYDTVHPLLETKSHVEALKQVILEVNTAVMAFYRDHGRYPSTVSELTRGIEGAGKFEWSIHGGGEHYPTIRIIHRDDSRIVGSFADGTFYIPKTVTQLQRKSTCQADTYMRDFIKNSDTRTARRLMHWIGVPDSVSREKMLTSMNKAIRIDCHVKIAK